MYSFEKPRALYIVIAVLALALPCDYSKSVVFVEYLVERVKGFKAMSSNIAMATMVEGPSISPPARGDHHLGVSHTRDSL